jgi:hypothetical protein
MWSNGLPGQLKPLSRQGQTALLYRIRSKPHLVVEKNPTDIKFNSFMPLMVISSPNSYHLSSTEGPTRFVFFISVYCQLSVLTGGFI